MSWAASASMRAVALQRCTTVSEQQAYIRLAASGRGALGQFEQGVVERDRMIWVRGSKLVELLSRRPARLNDEQIANAAAFLRSSHG